MSRRDSLKDIKRRFFWPNHFYQFRGFLHVHFGDCISGTLFSSRWSAIEYRHFLSRQKLRPGEWVLNHQTVAQIWDLFGKAEVDLFASQESSQCPLWFSLSSPGTLGIDAFAHPWPNMRLYAFPPVKLIPAVLWRVKVSGVRLLLITPFWPSQTWFSELVPLLYRPPWEILIRRDLLSQLQGRIWHPQPELWKLWVWSIQGHGPWWIICLSRFRRPSLVPVPPLWGCCTLPNGVSLSLDVWPVQ